MIRLLSWLLAKVIDLASRGEVAEHPDVIDEHAAPACALTRVPLHRPDRVVRDYPTTPAERRFADDIETFLKELTP